MTAIPRHTAAPERRGSVAPPPDFDDSAAPAGDRVLARARWIVGELFGPPEERDYPVRYWTGDLDPPAHGDRPPFTLVLRRPDTLRRMFLPPSELALGEAFVSGDFDVEGDLEAASALASVLRERVASPGRLLRVTRALVGLPRSSEAGGAAAPPSRRLAGLRGTRRRDASAIRHHYDVGNDFYALWLDAERVYSCGYFATEGESLEAAQLDKLDLICRKLRLRPGERLLDIGCGWGGLIRHAARHYGVTALGITLSPAQAAYASERIEADGLGERCRVELRDYRDLPADGSFDKVASVGMFEHVGRARLRTYFDTAFRALRRGGLFLNHGIVSLEEARPRGMAARLARRLWRGGSFIDRYVFPGGELAPLAAAIGVAEAAGFETRDVESLREHYVLTLRHWVQRLEARASDAASLVGPAVLRVWRLYMAASAHAFASGRIGVAQMLFARPDTTGRCCLPPTRHGLYASAAAGRPAREGHQP